MNTDFSNLRLRDSINTYKEIIDYAIEIGHEVIAITEHETVANAIKVQKYYDKIKQQHPNFKVILGNEIYLCRDGLNQDNFDKETDKYWHFILLAKDEIGHQQIREISTRAWERSYMTGKMRRVPTYYQDIIEIIGKNPGHVIGSTACLGGFLPGKILQWRKNQSNTLYNNIIEWCKKMQTLFGEGNFYLEMQPSNNEEQIYVNKFLKEISSKLGIDYIITTDSHYCKKQDKSIHKAYLTSQEGEREVDEFYDTTYMMNTEELESYFNYFSKEELDKSYQNILDIKNKCQDFNLLKQLKIPNLKWKEQNKINSAEYNEYMNYIPELKKFYNSSSNADRCLVDAVINGIKKHYDLQNPRAYQEINKSLEMTWVSSQVNNAEWSAYFLNLQQIIEVCWEAGTIIGPGRGSGVGFILLYLLDITQINPLRETTKTFAWRFLNPDRVSVLDVDIDIEGGRRGEVLEALRVYYGRDRVANVATFGTEKAKAAIQTAARGLGIDNDEAQYYSSLVPADRGTPRTLKQCYYGDEENGLEPVRQFVAAMNSNEELWKVAQKIEGLICRMGEHAGGVIFVDEQFTNSTALMRVPSGDIVTQFDLHDCEDVSLIKYDLLSVEGLDKIHTCLDLLTKDGYIDSNKSLRDRYEETIGIYNLERNNQEMWQMIWDHKIQALFQMEKQSGVKGIATLKPTSVDELAILNSTIRLMAQPGTNEMPTEKLARFKNNPKEWDKELAYYGLTDKEKKILEPVVGISYGLCIAQEQFMELVQLPELGGFSLTWADKLRKAIAKKNPAAFDELTKEFYTVTEQKGINQKFAHYVWDVLISMSKGYGFNQSHTLAYSLIGLQEMNLCYRFPIIYWNCSCLITDSGGEGGSTDYDKIAVAINKTKNAGVEIALPDINNSAFEFRPDKENNRIYCGLKNLRNVGDDVVKDIINNRPYKSIKDFYNKVAPKKQSMISLIKSGAFDSMIDRKKAMIWFIMTTCGQKKRITLQNMGSILEYDLMPKEERYSRAKRVYEFNRYLKACCKGNGNYILDNRGINFLTEIGCDEFIYQDNRNSFCLNTKEWDKQYQLEMDVVRDWIKNNHDNILKEINYKIFITDWIKYALGTYSSWEMEVLCFYHHEHELANVNVDIYGIKNFFELPEEPIIETTYTRGNNEIKIYKLDKICGTVIAKDKAHSTITLLTTTGVVPVKLRKEYFSFFDKQISAKGEDGKKKVIEQSWFKRGNMLVVQGMRSGNDFLAKKYANRGSAHQIYKISELLEDGKLVLQDCRVEGEN